jgi:hypothetical protein
MRKTVLLILVLSAFSFFVAAQSAQAAVLYGRSAVGYNPSARYIYGYGQTWTDYELALYYDPEVYTVLLQYETGLDSGSNVGYSDPYWGYQIAAEYDTFSTAYQQTTTYSTASHHKLRPYYTSYYGYWFDPFNFFGFSPGTYGDYGGLWGYSYNPYNYIPIPVVHPFNTWVSITTPPDCGPGGSGFTAGGAACPNPTPTPVPTPPSTCNIRMEIRSITTNTTETGDLSNQTRPAMLGARVDLESDPYVNNTISTGGTWTWSAEGNPVREDNGPFQSFTWRSEGTYNVSVSYTAENNCQVTSSMRVNVTVPTITSYTGDLIPERLTTDGTPCSNISGKDKFTLGCAQADQTLTQPGIKFTATAKIPDGSISDPTESKIKYVQIMNIYRRRQTEGRGVECMTFRGSESDYESATAWVVDSKDPYQNEFEGGGLGTVGVNSFGTNLTATITTRDSPGNTLVFPEQYHSLKVDDRFEMLVYYFTGESAPQFSDPGTTKVIGRLAWNWGGQVNYNPISGFYVYDPANPSPRVIPGESARQVRPFTNLWYVPDQDPNAFKQCPGGGGGPTPTPTPTPMPTPVPTPPNGCSGNNSAFVSQSVPTVMDVGLSYNVAITMKNNCSATWTPDRYKLGSENPQDNWTWGFNRVYLPSDVSIAPGDTHTFNFTVTAPQTPGFYNFQWRMVEEGVQWFGEFTPNVMVQVVGSGCDPWAEQDCYYNGGNWDSVSCQCTIRPPCPRCDWEIYPTY